MGEDVCLYEEDDKFVNSCPNAEMLHDELESNKNDEILAHKIDS